METVKVLEQAAKDQDVREDVIELNDLQLALVGGGGGDVVFH